MAATSTLSPEDTQKITDFLAEHPVLARGLGNAYQACSIASINLALSGRLTDDIPECMSRVIGRWIIRVQDAMPDSIRNSDAWRNLLPAAAGTGRGKEIARRDIILNWMWGTVLPTVQEIADKRGFGTEWREMLMARTAAAAQRARKAAAAYADAAAVADAAVAAYAADADAAAAASAAVAADADAAVAAYAAVAADADAAVAAAAYAAAYAADAAAYAAVRLKAWGEFDPAALLQALIDA